MSKKQSHSLPPSLYVRREEDGDEHYFLAFENGCAEAVEDDGPTCVGIYNLVNIYPNVQKVVDLGDEAES